MSQLTLEQVLEKARLERGTFIRHQIGCDALGESQLRDLFTNQPAIMETRKKMLAIGRYTAQTTIIIVNPALENDPQNP